MTGKKLTPLEQAINACVWIQMLLEASKDNIKQARQQLGSFEDGFCCLGYGCFLLDIPYDPKKGDSHKLAHAVGLVDSIGYEVIWSPDRTWSRASGAFDLTSLNDSSGWSLRDIGVYLEKNYRRYFWPEVSEHLEYLL